MRAAGFEATERVGERRPGRRGAAVWLGVLGLVATLGIVGRVDVTEQPPETGADRPAPSARSATVTDQPLVLTAPALPPIAIGGRIDVRGRAAPGIDEVELILVKGFRAWAHEVVVPGAGGRFAATFGIEPGLAGHITIVAVADAASDGSRPALRRPVLLAENRDVAGDDGRPARERRLGEDGLLGARGVDLASLRPVPLPQGLPAAAWWTRSAAQTVSRRVRSRA